MERSLDHVSPPPLRWHFALGPLLAGLTLFNVLAHPHRAAVGAFGVLLLVALLEAGWPRLRRSPPAAPGPGLLWLLRLHVPLQLALIGAGLWAARDAGWGTVAGLAFAVGFVAGAQGITYAHELGHARHRADRALAWVLMASVNYSHFMVEHYRGHHVRAATRADPASARLGESLWRFLPRTLAGSLASAWRLEAARLRMRRQGWRASPLAWCTAAGLAAAILLGTLWGAKPLVFWLLMSAVAVWLLETVNYIEHYGLRRAVGADGRPEPFGLMHAWNADHAISNALLANLQRHSDHHMHAWKPFPELAPLPGPQLPTGYAGCLFLAQVPPVWFRVMHRRVPA
jgi:alkane 1-monooxygenase